MDKQLIKLMEATLEASMGHYATTKSVHDEAAATVSQSKPLMKEQQRFIAYLRTQLKKARGDAPDRRSETDRITSTNKDEVTELIEAVLERHGPMPRQRLKQVVGEEVRKRGRDHKMYANIFSKSLAADKFVDQPDGNISVASENGWARDRKREDQT